MSAIERRISSRFKADETKRETSSCYYNLLETIDCLQLNCDYPLNNCHLFILLSGGDYPVLSGDRLLLSGDRLPLSGDGNGIEVCC